MRAFLFYWQMEQLQQVLDIGFLHHAGSGQFTRVSVGDRVWICGRTEGSAELYVIGYIDVAAKVDEDTAQAEMDRRLPDYVVWSADWHILSNAGTACPTRLVSMQPIYGRLFFESPKNRRLALTDGHPNAQQLQTMRQLTPDGAARMTELWAKG